jgi:hypothetical protein
MRRLIRAIHDRRAVRRLLDEADRLVAGARTGEGSPGLDHLLDAARTPGTAAELRGGPNVIAALAAERRRVAPPSVIPAPRRRRIAVVTAAAALVLVTAGGTAVAARTGSLQGLLPDLVEPAPATVHPATPAPAPMPAPARSSPAPRRGTEVPSGIRVTWCRAWLTATAGGHPMNGRDRKDLIGAAGGEKNLTAYCAGVTIAPVAGPTKTHKSHKPKKPKAPK